jgi:hypothetical protein
LEARGRRNAVAGNERDVIGNPNGVQILPRHDQRLGKDGLRRIGLDPELEANGPGTINGRVPINLREAEA